MSSRKHTHSLAVTSSRVLFQLLSSHGFSVRYTPRIAYLLGTSLVGMPFRLLDRCVSTRQTRQTRIKQPPLFILGHWRSGTTHLHNLLSLDAQFGALTMYHCIASSSFLFAPKLTRRLLTGKLPDKRPMDAMAVSLDAPQEEELAMARISDVSYNHCYHFPQQARRIFRECVLFDSDDDRIAARWKETYEWLLRRLAIDQQQRQLCLKNPANTARIRQLIELFPDARFIHIYRNPYIVYRSTLHMWMKVLPIWALQQYTHQEVEENVFWFYSKLMQRFFEDCRIIPHRQFTEVRFEDLENNPIDELHRIYNELSLDGFEATQPTFEAYLSTLNDYRKNTYDFEEGTLQQIEKRWGFALKRWEYERPPSC